MIHYISKDALVAEIKRRKQTWQHQDQQYVAGGRDVCDYLLGFLDTPEMKEMDLEEEINEWLLHGNITDNYYNDYCDADIIETAKHFFELGMAVRNKAQKGE